MTTSDIGPGVLGDVRKQMQIDDEWLISQPRMLTWWGYRLAQRIWADPPVLRRGLSIVGVQAETDLLVEVPDTSETEQAIATLNSTAALNAIVWHRNEARVTLRCSMCVHPDVRSWLTRVFCSAVAMQVAEAESRVELLQEMLGGKVAVSGHPANGERQEPDDMLNVLPFFTTAKEDPSPFHGGEMLNLCEFLEQRALATGDESGLSVEFPFSGTAPPTVLVRVFSSVPHPTYGAGALLLMKLPTLPSGRQTGAVLANELNLAEIGQIDAGYGFGAWCLDVEGGSGTAFVLFLPAALFASGLLQRIVTSLSRKAQWCHLWLDLGNDANEIGAWHKVQAKMLDLLSRAAKR